MFSCVKKILRIPDRTGEIPLNGATRDHLRVPGTHRDPRSPHRYSINSQDIDLSDTVANFVDFVKEGRQTRHRYRHNMHTRYRGIQTASIQ